MVGKAEMRLEVKTDRLLGWLQMHLLQMALENGVHFEDVGRQMEK